MHPSSERQVQDDYPSVQPNQPGDHVPTFVRVRAMALSLQFPLAFSPILLLTFGMPGDRPRLVYQRGAPNLI
jgi:hypothetical protein